MQQLQDLMSLLDCAVDGTGHLPEKLHFEDLFAARVATLLLPDLASNESRLGLGLTADAKSRLDELLEYIGANPSLPLSLTDLCGQSGLSRDQLKQHFHHRFGMGPMRWLREQRMQRLNRMLQH